MGHAGEDCLTGKTMDPEQLRGPAPAKKFAGAAR
jgi:hypothetical protein